MSFHLFAFFNFSQCFYGLQCKDFALPPMDLFLVKETVSCKNILNISQFSVLPHETYAAFIFKGYLAKAVDLS